MKHAGWHIEDIKAALRKKHGPLSALSVAWGYEQSRISAVLTNPLRSQAVELRIAEVLGVATHVLWPDRWHPDGTPKPRVWPMRRPRPLNQTSQKRGAA